MKCGALINVHGEMRPCGQCMPCRINKKRLWSGRIMLEAAHAGSPSTFLTLTYDDEHLPEKKSLQNRHLAKYIDRLRHREGLGFFRFFGVGEYGNKTGRPHYHMVVFGIDPASEYAEILQQCWTYGFTHIGLLEKGSAAYVCGYTTKKMTNIDDERLDGRNPEFATYSRRPPLGYAGVNHIKNLLQTRTGAAALAEHGDVPSSFRLLGSNYPLGRYWLDQLRKEVGITNPPRTSEWELDYEKVTKEREQAEKLSTKLWRRRTKDNRTL